MAPSGHIKLGPYGDLRPYVLENVKDVRRDGANPYASPSGGNQGYNDLQGWAEWTMQDWQAGAGKKDPEAGGFLFSTCETRVPHQVILPQRAWVTGSRIVMRDAMAEMAPYSPITVGPAAAIRKYGMVWLEGSGGGAMLVAGTDVYVYCYAPFGTTVTVDVVGHSELPAAQLGKNLGYSGSITSSNRTKSPRWERITVGTDGTNTYEWNSNYFAVVVSASADITLYRFSDSGALGGVSYNGTAWSVVANTINGCVIPKTIELRGASVGSNITFLAEHGGEQWASSGKTLFRWFGDASVNEKYWYPHTSATYVTEEITSLVSFGLSLYIGQGTGNFAKMTYTGGAWTFSDGGSPGVRFAKANGLLWKQTSNDIYYSNDGTTWTAVADVTPSGIVPLALAGMGQNMYFATSEGLYYIAPGDFVCGVIPWHTKSSVTYTKMVEWQGDLYILANNILYRLDQSHTLLPLRVPSDDDNLDGYGRSVYSIAASQSYLYVGTYGTSGGMVWAWSPEGWHTVAIIPDIPYNLGHNRGLNALWIGSDNVVWRVRHVDATINPYRDPGAIFASHAWVEFDRFYGPVVRLQKDFESVYLDGENIGSGTTVAVYYRFENDQDWSLLGTHNSGENVELRWLLGSGREASHYVRFALLLASTMPTETPKLAVFSLKYIPMVNDRYKWNLTIKAPQVMFDVGSETYTDTYSQSSLITHLDACIRSVVPILYEDVDGTQYQVKVTSHSRSVDNWTLKRAGSREISYTYHLGIEQVA